MRVRITHAGRLASTAEVPQISERSPHRSELAFRARSGHAGCIAVARRPFRLTQCSYLS
jgi:hypothetical protein